MASDENCFFCGITCPSLASQVLPPQLHSPTTVSDPPAMRRNLMSMFLTKEVLDAPASLCETLLKTKGDPQNWFQCCQACSYLAKKGMIILSQVQRLRSSFDDIKKSLRRKLELYRQIADDSTYGDCLKKYANRTVNSKVVIKPVKSSAPPQKSPTVSTKIKAQPKIKKGLISATNDPNKAVIHSKPLKQLQCKFCSLKLPNNKLYRRHVKSHATKDFKKTASTVLSGKKCVHCKKTFPRHEHLMRHIRDFHKGATNSITDVENERGSSRTNMSENGDVTNKATRTTRVKYAWPCRQIDCGKSFSTKKELETHFAENHEKIKVRTSPEKRKSPSPAKKSRCRSCGMQFNDEEDMKKHIYEKHPENHCCPYCNKGFLFLAHLNTHKTACQIKNCTNQSDTTNLEKQLSEETERNTSTTEVSQSSNAGSPSTNSVPVSPSSSNQNSNRTLSNSGGDSSYSKDLDRALEKDKPTPSPSTKSTEKTKITSLQSLMLLKKSLNL